MRYGLNRFFPLVSGVGELVFKETVNPAVRRLERLVSNSRSVSNHGCAIFRFGRRSAIQDEVERYLGTSSRAFAIPSVAYNAVFSRRYVTTSSSPPSLSSPSSNDVIGLRTASRCSDDRVGLAHPFLSSSQLATSLDQFRQLPLSISSSVHSIHVRRFSVDAHRFSSANDKNASSTPSPNDDHSDKDKTKPGPEDAPSSSNSSSSNSSSSSSKGLVHRFHKAYKNYGKVLIGFHCVTYCLYFTSFLGVSYAGLDVVVFLEWLRDHVHLPQSVIETITKSGAGHFAVAFILCKVISPIRYLTTIVGTKYTADYLRRRGYMAPVPQGDRFKELAKESQELIKTKMERSGRRLRKVNEVRMRKTNKTVKDWRTNIRFGRRSAKK